MSVWGCDSEDDSVQLTRSDVWDVKWADDDHSAMAVMEKSKLVLLHETVAEEPVRTNNYLISVGDLEAKTIDLVMLMSKPTVCTMMTMGGRSLLDEMALKAASCVQEPSEALLETSSAQSLRKAEALLDSSLDEAFTFAEGVPHHRLWHMLGRRALQQQMFDLAIKGFVRMHDYKTIQYIKQVCAHTCFKYYTASQLFTTRSDLLTTSALQVEQLQDSSKQEAEIAAFFGKYDDAVAIHTKNGRLDLALQLLMRLGQVERAEAIIKVQLTTCLSLHSWCHLNDCPAMVSSFRVVKKG
jgi:hypothetical protein